MIITTTANMCNLGLVFRAIRADRDSKRPTVNNLRTVGSLETYRELTIGQFRDRLQQARLQAFCLDRVPTKRGQPKTTIATCDEGVVTL